MERFENVYDASIYGAVEYIRPIVYTRGASRRNTAHTKVIKVILKIDANTNASKI